MATSYYIQTPTKQRLPILISCPHSGVEIPPDLARLMHTELALSVPDTDWFVHELYDFAPSEGITLIHARFSRYVIDLNRDPQNQQLYQDQRFQTGLVPTHSFAKKPIYKQSEPDAADIRQRLEAYYRPYHERVRIILQELKNEFGYALLWEAHSIKRRVPSIRPEPFPDLMLGDQKGKTAASALSTQVLESLRQRSGYEVEHNEPFMGGYLTRFFGRPQEKFHALQLEMAQDVYMNEDDGCRDPAKLAKIRPVLQRTLLTAAQTLSQLYAAP